MTHLIASVAKAQMILPCQNIGHEKIRPESDFISTAYQEHYRIVPW
jgi:hypothetical protein